MQRKFRQRWEHSHSISIRMHWQDTQSLDVLQAAQAKTDKEVFENFIAKLEELKEKIGIKKTIKDYGIDEKYFLDTLDEMCRTGIQRPVYRR